MIGLLGSHRTGKTTLGRAFAQRYNMPFLQTNVGDTFQRLGRDPKKDYDFGTRLFIQQEILKDIEAKYREMNGVYFITDRTPLDLLAYTIADIQRANMPADLVDPFMEYYQDCMRVTNQTFWVVALIQPGIPIVEEEGKAPANKAYMEHLNLIMKGLLGDHSLLATPAIIRRRTLDLERRIITINNVLRKQADAMVEHRNFMGEH